MKHIHNSLGIHNVNIIDNIQNFAIIPTIDNIAIRDMMLLYECSLSYIWRLLVLHRFEFCLLYIAFAFRWLCCSCCAHSFSSKLFPWVPWALSIAVVPLAFLRPKDMLLNRVVIMTSIFFEGLDGLRWVPVDHNMVAVS